MTGGAIGGEALLLGLRLFFGLLFLGAIVHKVTDFERFTATLRSYFRPLAVPVAGWLLGALGVIVIALECAAVFLLVMGGPMLAAAWTATLLLAYAAAMALNILAGNRLLDCGCGWGAEQQPVSGFHIVRNAVLAALAMAIAGFGTASAGISLQIAAIAHALFIAAALGIFLTFTNQLILNGELSRRSIPNI